MGDFLGVSEHLQDFAAYIRNEIDFGFALEPDHDMLAEQNKEAHLQELHERLHNVVSQFHQHNPDDDAFQSASSIKQEASEQLFKPFNARNHMYPFDEYPPTPHSESEDTEILDVEMSELSVLVEPDYADFEGVLSDHQLRERYKSEFDPWWIEKRGVEGKFELFDKKYTSRLKQEDLFKHGVFKDQDTFYIETTAQNGAKIMRGVRADGFKGDKGRDAYTPNIELPAQEPTDPPARHEPCVGPKEIIKAITGHYNEIRRPYNVWKEIIVFRNDQLIIGTMHEARQRFAFWQLVVDRYTDRNGLPGRRRRIMDPITRAHTGMPALTVNLNWYPPNPRDRIVQQ